MIVVGLGRGVGLVAVLVLVGGLSACGASLGQVKTEALDEVEAMSGLSDSQRSETLWMVDQAGEKELVARYLESARAANVEGLAAAEERESAASSEVSQWVGVPLRVVEAVSWLGVVGETLVLSPDGSVEATGGLAEVVGGFWVQSPRSALVCFDVDGSEGCQWAQITLQASDNSGVEGDLVLQDASRVPAARAYLDIDQ